MEEQVYNFKIAITWKLLRTISQIDRFDASWASIERVEGQNLKYLKSVATIKSVGASTRIEGSKLSDQEVKMLLANIAISKIEDRDSQEVVGYFNVHDLITESYGEIHVSESGIKSLHNQLLKLSEKDEWHRGDYKPHANAVEAVFPDGTRQLIFKTTEPGFATEDAMQLLVQWFSSEKEVHPLIKIAAFVYEFVSIHPFQDGNGRLSRLLTTLLLMQAGYKWIQYVSFEHEIESSKIDYYRSLRSCQSQRPGEDISDWIDYFFESLRNVQVKLEQKLKVTSVESKLSPKEKSIYSYISANPGCMSGEISAKLNIPGPTVKRLLTALAGKQIIERHGRGAGTNYSVK